MDDYKPELFGVPAEPAPLQGGGTRWWLPQGRPSAELTPHVQVGRHDVYSDNLEWGETAAGELRSRGCEGVRFGGTLSSDPWATGEWRWVLRDLADLQPLTAWLRTHPLETVEVDLPDAVNRHSALLFLQQRGIGTVRITVAPRRQRFPAFPH